MESVKTVVILTGFCLIWTAEIHIVSGTTVFRNCGGRLTSPAGIIQSPNFPKQFPTPIKCEWVIHNPQTMKTVLYLTQFYLSDHVQIWQFDHYSNVEEYIGAKKLATVDFKNNIYSITVNRPYIVVRFAVAEMASIHARVLDHLVDVYGFNITYEFLDQHNTDIKRTCSMHGCSYLGNCYASADFSEYQCHCFEGYFGRNCQFGPHCNPSEGVNMCKNGGQCRYFYGSSVNVCDCADGFMGYQCEIPLSDTRPDACSSLVCEQSCLDGPENQKMCSCYQDFRLNSDNRTCTHIDRTRITISVQPTADFIQTARRDGVFPKINSVLVNDLRNDVNIHLQSERIMTMSKFKVEEYRVTSQVELVFHFSIEDEEKGLLSKALKNMAEASVIGNIHIQNDSLSYQQEPELFLKDVASSVSGGELWNEFYGNSATEGKFLTLSCLARGSKSTKFRWFKDGHLIDINLSNRNSYQTLIHSKREDTIRSVLHFEHVTPYDRGVFTCEARSVDNAQNKSELVNVITLPLVDIDPLADSVPVNGSISIRCLSIDDTLDTFTYEWFEDGKPIKTGRQDKIPEKLIPTGYQLYVRYLEKSTVFTCRVINEAGPVNVTSHIYVQPMGRQNETCPRQWYKDVVWQKTVGRHYEKQRCPLEAGDFSSYIPNDVGGDSANPVNTIEGYTTRKCKCNGQQYESCQWEEPNFSKCQSVALVQVYDQLEMLRLGYQSTTVQTIFKDLHHFLSKDNFTFYSGDIDMAASILRQLLRHLQEFPVHADESEKISVTSIIYLMDKMMKAANSSTLEEKRDVTIGENLIGTGELLASDLSEILKFDIDTQINSVYLEMNVKEDVPVFKQESMEFLIKLTNGPSKRDLSKTTDNGEPLSISVMILQFRKIETFLSAKLNEKLSSDRNPVSEVFSIYPYPTNNYSSYSINADVNIPFNYPSYYRKFVEFQCLSWKEVTSYTVEGGWANDSCVLISTGDLSVTCRCKIPGHFMVVGVTANTTVEINQERANMRLFLLICCIISMCGLTASLMIILFRCRDLIGDEYIIYINFMISLIGVNCIFIVCLTKPGVEIICIASRLLLYWLFLVAYVFSLVDSLHTFIIVNSKDRIGRHCYKYLVVGWGIPVVLSIFFVITSELFGYGKECSDLCWIPRGHWQFYCFLTPVAVAILVVLIFTALSLKKCLSWTDECSVSNRRQIMLKCGKSVILILLLTAVSFLSTDIDSEDHTLQIIFLFVCKLLLMVAVFLFRVFLDNQMLIKCWKLLPKPSDSEENSVGLKRQSSNAFKAYIKPERVRNSGVGKEQESVHKYYTRVNRTKYTRERKRELSSLLGSSTTSHLMNSSVGSYLSSHYKSNNGENSTMETNVMDTGSESGRDFQSSNNESASSVNISVGDGKILTIPEIHIQSSQHLNGPSRTENPNQFNERMINNYNQARILQNQKNRKKNGYNKNGLSKSNYNDNPISEKEELSNLLHSQYEEKTYST